MSRYRWLDDSLTYRGRLRTEWRGRLCRIIALPVPGGVGNVLIRFDDGELSIVPMGTLRRPKEQN